MTRPRPTGLAVWLLTALAVSGLAGAVRAADPLLPLGSPETVAIGRTGTPYLVVGLQAVTVPVMGPGEVTLYVRVSMPTEGAVQRAGNLTIGGLPGPDLSLDLDFLPSRAAAWPDDRPGRPSAGTRAVFPVPAGRHDLRLTGQARGGDPLLVALYYQGPVQPSVPGLLIVPATAEAAPDEPAEPLWSFSGDAGLDIIYNDNILTNSNDDLEDFLAGLAPWKFIQESNDDLVLAPSLGLQGQADLIGWGPSRLSFKVKRWMYAFNPVKTNTDFNFYARQYFGTSRSLEAFFHFAPEQFIGMLSDRNPLDDPDAPLAWREFRFQRNTWNLTWRQRINRRFSGKAIFERNFRYYNQPFMENDIEAWELRGSLSWRISRAVTLDLDYSYEDAAGRAVDEVGETPTTSDNSDPGYRRDLYRVGLALKPRALKRYLDGFDLSFLFMDYYYTTGRTLVDDPYHVGRRDTYYKATVEADRRLTRSVSVKAAVRRTQRLVYSPWEGDITTDKDFTQWLYWVNLNYRF